MTVERMCAVCRQRFDKSKLLRVVKFKDGDVRIDESGKLQGRGMYICKSGKCISQAEKRKVIERAFSVGNCHGIYEEILKRLEQST